MTSRRRDKLETGASQGESQCAFPRPFCLITALGDIGPRFKPGPIGSIIDDILLKIFSFYVEESYEAYEPDKFNAITKLEVWRPLVHVCRRWRNLVFASPRSLNLRLVCTGRRPVSELLGIWPFLPIVIDEQPHFGRYPVPLEERAENICAALEHRSRVCQISFSHLSRSLSRIFTTMMQGSFPALNHLYFDLEAESPTPLPDSFLGGYAPRLRSLTLASIPFPSLPTLLLTTKDLVELRLWSITEPGYISPAAMVTCLSSLPRLENLELRFDFGSLPDGPRQRPPLLTRIDLPTLTQFEFVGANEYIEELVAWINAPLLRDVFIAFFNKRHFDTSQLNQFIGRTKSSKLLHRAVVDFDRSASPQISLSEDPVSGPTLGLLASCTPLEQQLSSLEILSSSPSSPLQPSSFERLDIPNGITSPENWDDDLAKVRWLELLQPFTSAKYLYLGNGIAPHIIRMLRNLVGERATELLPALQRIFVQDCQQFEALRKSMEPFISARQLSGHPVAVHRWD